MANLERERLAALARKAAALQKVWLRERDEKRAMQASANAEVRLRWIESDSRKDEATSTADHRKDIDHDSRDASS